MEGRGLPRLTTSWTSEGYTLFNLAVLAYPAGHVYFLIDGVHHGGEKNKINFAQASACA